MAFLNPERVMFHEFGSLSSRIYFTTPRTRIAS